MYKPENPLSYVACFPRHPQPHSAATWQLRHCRLCCQSACLASPSSSLLMKSWCPLALPACPALLWLLSQPISLHVLPLSDIGLPQCYLIGATPVLTRATQVEGLPLSYSQHCQCRYSISPKPLSDELEDMYCANRCRVCSAAPAVMLLLCCQE